MNDDKTKPTVPCPVCRIAWTAAGLAACSRCRRLAAYGLIVEALADMAAELHWGADFQTAYLDALDAVADLLTDHAITARDHRRELREAERDSRQAGRESYDTGYQDGTQTAGGGG